MNQEYYFVACPGVLGVRTNVRDFKWSFGTSMPTSSRDAFEACQVRLNVEIDRHLQLPPIQQRTGKYHYWSGSSGEDAIYYDRGFCFGSRLQLAATGLLGEEPVIRANSTYSRYVSHRFMNLHSLGYILTDLASLLLLRRGYSPLHCSAFKSGDATVVIAAPPNTGKTLTSVMACMEHQANYLAEDLAITDGQDIFSVPWTSTFRYYKQIDSSLLSRIKNRATTLIPPIELLSTSPPKPITCYIDPQTIMSRSRVTHLVMLERGDEKVRLLGSDEAYSKVRNLNRYEFNYNKAPLVVAHEFFSPELDIEGACRAENALLRKLVDSADRRLVVQTSDPTRYVEMILEEIRQQAPSSRVEPQAA